MRWQNLEESSSVEDRRGMGRSGGFRTRSGIPLRGNPIKGLYAAGEATGGVHGMVRLGTVAVADCMIFGRIAARDAFKKA